MAESVRSAVLRLLDILFKSDLSYSELESSLMMTVWGLWLTLFPSSSAAKLIPYKVIAYSFIIFGILQFYGLIRGNSRLRRLTGLASIGLWAFVSLIMMQRPATILLPTTLGFCAGGFWAVLRMEILFSDTRPRSNGGAV